MTDLQLIAAINAIVGPIVIFLIGLEEAALFLRTAWTIARFGWRGVPVLQWRDLLFFSALTVIVIGSQYSRITGAALGMELWWVVLTDALILASLIAYPLIEFGVLGRKGDERGPVL